MESDSLQINLGDRDDVRAKLPSARDILSRKERALADFQHEVDLWRGHVEYLERVAGLEPPPTARSEPKPEPGEGTARQPQELVVDVVNRETRAITGKEVRAILEHEGHDLSTERVNNALYYAGSRAKKIQKLGRGIYAPLTYKDEVIFGSANGGNADSQDGPSSSHGAVQRLPEERTGGNPPGAPRRSARGRSIGDENSPSGSPALDPRGTT